MELSKLLSKDNSLLIKASKDSYKLSLDLKKTQSLEMLPKSPDYVLSNSLLNQISEASYLTANVIRNYEAKMSEAGMTTDANQNKESQIPEFTKTTQAANSFNLDLLI